MKGSTPDVNNNSPFISVIIPVFNNEKYLADAIESILSQKYEPLEIIVVDDGSTDDTKSVAQRFDIVQYVHQSNNGPASARNTGLKIAKGEVIAFIDSDDLWSDNKLEVQLPLLTNIPYIEIVIGYTQRLRLCEADIGKPTFSNYLEPMPMLSLGGAIIRKTTFDRVGCFDETFIYCDDVDWFLRAREKNIPVVIHQEIVQYYRKHNTNLTLNNQIDLKYQLLAFKKSLDRRRNQGNGTIKPTKGWFDFLVTR